VAVVATQTHMKTLRRLIYRDIVGSVAFVAAAFLALFFFIDFVEELNRVQQGKRQMTVAIQVVLMQMPGHLYELLPICVLIGSIYALARMAQTSEFTILRTGGLGPGRALALLAGLGLAFAALTFWVGDGWVPAAERQAAELKARGSAEGTVERSGAWLKERRKSPDSVRSVTVHIRATSSAGELLGVRIFEFDADSRLLRRLEAQRAQFDSSGTWLLQDVRSATWSGSSDVGMHVEAIDALPWRTTLEPSVVSAAVMPLQTMSTWGLWRYSQHLSSQEQATQRHLLQFWKRALYPLACLVMVALALPFAYMHARSGGVSLRVFGGILLGISFILLNNMAGHVGLLRGWTPWLVAAAPAMMYTALSMAAFAWLVRYR